VTLADASVALLLIWAASIAVIDWRHRKVPNLWLLMALLPTLLLMLWQGAGPLGAGAKSSAAGFAAGLGLALPGYWASRLGAGDVKLAAVMGLLLGWPLVLWSLLAAALMLGALSLAAVAHLGLANARGLRLPAAIALAGGFAVVLIAAHEGWV